MGVWMWMRVSGRREGRGCLGRSGVDALALILCRGEAETRVKVEEAPLPCPHVLLEPPNVQEALLKLQMWT